MPRSWTKWTMSMDADLRRLTSARSGPSQIAAELNRVFGLDLTVSAVQGRQVTLGLRPSPVKRRRGGAEVFFTPDRKQELRERWSKGESLVRIRKAFGYSVTVAAISDMAHAMNLPKRYQKHINGRKVLVIRSEGEADVAPGARKPQPPRFTNPVVTGCPFIEPVKPLTRCGAPGDGYCARHAARVIPIPKGPLGFVRRHSGGVSGLRSTG